MVRKRRGEGKTISVPTIRRVTDIGLAVFNKKVTASDRYFARRLLSFSIVSKDEDITRILSTVQKGIKPNDKELAGLEDKWNILKREDELFSGIGLMDKQKQIDQATKPLPTSYEKEQLNKLRYADWC